MTISATSPKVPIYCDHRKLHSLTLHGISGCSFEQHKEMSIHPNKEKTDFWPKNLATKWVNCDDKILHQKYVIHENAQNYIYILA